MLLLSKRSFEEGRIGSDVNIKDDLFWHVMFQPPLSFIRLKTPGNLTLEFLVDHRARGTVHEYCFFSQTFVYS